MFTILRKYIKDYKFYSALRLQIAWRQSVLVTQRKIDVQFQLGHPIKDYLVRQRALGRHMKKPRLTNCVFVSLVSTIIFIYTHSHMHRNSCSMIREDYNIDVRAIPRHRSILEHRIVHRRYKCVYFSSLFPECIVSLDHKTQFSFLRTIFDHWSLRYGSREKYI